MRRAISILLFIFFSFFHASAQQFMGMLVEKTNKGEESLVGAMAHWQGTNISAQSDTMGMIMINFPDSFPAKLIVSLTGYQADTILFSDKKITKAKIKMKSITQLKEININAHQNSTNISLLTPINVEIMNKNELLKAACCNLSESFENSASVDVNYTDAVSGAKQIQMLGLDGIYTQILSENLPLIRGMSSSYGLNYVPGSWVENILVTKGAGSVVNGYESITGQLNIELLEPGEADKFFVNLYGNQQGRMEANMHYAERFTKNFSTLIMAHASGSTFKMDRNNDGFLDMPLTKQFNVLNRWHYQIPNKLEMQFGIKAMQEDRTGGQADFKYDRDFGDTMKYGIGINNKQIETFTKTGFMFPSKPYKSIAFTTSERIHQQDMFFGNKKYSGQQESVYINGIYQTIIGNTFHKIKFGPSLIYDHYNESFNDSVFKHENYVPGVYTEYTYNRPDTSFSLVIGAREDYHSQFGFKFTPRVHFKYNFGKLTALRLSVGSGWRTANIFPENASVFANSRKVIVQEALKPEEAWNEGISFTHKFQWLKHDAYFNTDYFRTDFVNQVIVDLEESDKVKFYNLNGRSYSNSFQTEFGFSPFERFDVKLAYKHYDVMSTYSGQLKEKPFVPRDRVLLNLAYATNFNKWKFDLTVKWFGKSRIPDLSGNADAVSFPTYANEYYTLNAQITKRFMYFDVYLGGENLLDYHIQNSIISPTAPFGPNFDASMNWGPTSGIVVYGGLRFSIK